MATFSKSKVWHSHMKYASPLVVKFKGDVMDSKFDDSRIIFFETREPGNPEGTYLVCESPAVEAAVSQAPKGQWVTVTALGGGREPTDDEASLLIEPADNESYTPPARSSGGGSSSGGSSSGERFGPPNILDAYKEAVQVAMDNFPGSNDNGILTDFGHRHANSLFIQFYRTGRYVPLFEGQQREGEYGAPVREEPAAPTEDKRLAAIRSFMDQVGWTGESHDGINLETVKQSIQGKLDNNDFSSEDITKTIDWLGKESVWQQKEDKIESDLPF